MTQKEHVLKLIQEAGVSGISTNELRNITHAVDVPKCVSDLNKIGYDIESVENGDNTVTYYLKYQHIKKWVHLPSGNYGWVSQGLKKIQAPSKKRKVYPFPQTEEYRRDDGSIGYRTI
jgi:hypothetical protein